MFLNGYINGIQTLYKTFAIQKQPSEKANMVLTILDSKLIVKILPRMVISSTFKNYKQPMKISKRKIISTIRKVLLSEYNFAKLKKTTNINNMKFGAHLYFDWLNMVEFQIAIEEVLDISIEWDEYEDNLEKTVKEFIDYIYNKIIL